MNICIVTSVSEGTPWASITLPNRLAYCLRHGYAMLAYCEPYGLAVKDGLPRVRRLLDEFDLVWTLDADCLVTDLRQRIEAVPGLGSHASICREGLFDNVPINGGSIVWRNTAATRELIDQILAAEPEWRAYSHNVQQWLAMRLDLLAGKLAVCDSRNFNGVHHHNQCVWQPGDFVYHPCGMPPGPRCELLRSRLQDVVS